MLVLNAYYSKGQMNDPKDNNKIIKWDNVVLEGLGADYQTFETRIFGSKFEKIKINREDFLRVYQDDITKLENQNVMLLYNANKRIVSLQVMKTNKQ